MKKYLVSVWHTSHGFVEVMADDESEAESLAYGKLETLGDVIIDKVFERNFDTCRAEEIGK